MLVLLLLCLRHVQTDLLKLAKEHRAAGKNDNAVVKAARRCRNTVTQRLPSRRRRGAANAAANASSSNVHTTAEPTSFMPVAATAAASPVAAAAAVQAQIHS
jgi:hypothetical protein